MGIIIHPDRFVKNEIPLIGYRKKLYEPLNLNFIITELAELYNVHHGGEWNPAENRVIVFSELNALSKRSHWEGKILLNCTNNEKTAPFLRYGFV